MEIPYNLALEIFDLKVPVNDGEVIKAYRRLAKTVHPDKGGDEKLFCFITECKDVLLKNKTFSKNSENNKDTRDTKPNSEQPAKKSCYVTLSDLYDLYFRLNSIRRECDISEIRMTSHLYVYPIFKKKKTKILTMHAYCDFAEFSKFGYVPLKCSIYIPENFNKYNKFCIRFELLDKTIKKVISANSVNSFKFDDYRFNTILDITLIKSNG